MQLIDLLLKVIRKPFFTQPNKAGAGKQIILSPSDCWTTTAGTTVPPDEQ